MLVVRSMDGLASARAPLALAAGTFDGVHLGHVAVLERAIAATKHLGGSAWALTFDPHPLKILHPPAAPALITSTDHKLRLFERLGLDGALVLPFTPELAAVEPEDFIAALLRSAPGLHTFAIGSNWRFGRKARGDVSLLGDLGQRHGFRVDVVQPVLAGGKPVSSTRIRKAIQAGDLETARAMLGRRFDILGPVIPGRRIGRTLGFPTANVDPRSEVRPPPGIYAVRASLDGATHAGAAYLGGTEPARASSVVEVHLIDYRGDLYGREIDVAFVAKLRDDQVFASQEALVAQIARDVAEARRLAARD